MLFMKTILNVLLKIMNLDLVRTHLDYQVVKDNYILIQDHII
jgi:hypothetical protein